MKLFVVRMVGYMSKKKYGFILCMFATIFAVGVVSLRKQSEKIENDAVITIWSYYTGAHNDAIETYEEKTGNYVHYEGIGYDNYGTKINTVLGTEEEPDIIIIDPDMMGRYIDSDNFLNFDDVFSGDDLYDEYLDNVSSSLLSLGNVEGKQKAISFENSSSVFYYRTDLAEQCLGISSSAEMEAATQTISDYQTLYDNLQANDDNACQISLFATGDYKEALLNLDYYFSKTEDGLEIKDDAYTIIEKLNELDSSKLAYSKNGSKQFLKEENEEDRFLGDISSVNKMLEIYNFDQSGKWAVADTPVDYVDGGPYFLISKNANVDAVKEYFDLTFFNQDWLSKNIDNLGIIDYGVVMNKDSLSEYDFEQYFNEDNIYSKLTEISQNNSSNKHVSKYDDGAIAVLKGVYNEYNTGGIETEEEIRNKIIDDMNNYYPTVNVK